jgi:hypothetical protein
MLQADKDSLLDTARTAFTNIISAISGIVVDQTAPADLQGQITALQAQVADVQAKAAADSAQFTAQLHDLQIANASLADKIATIKALLA